MKFLFINSVCGVGSTGRICAELADSLINDGHICRIAYGRGSVPEGYRDIAVRIGGNASVLSHAAYARAFDKMGLGSRAATLRFIKRVREYDPDVIHLHNIHGYYINIEILFDYLAECGKPVIWTLHDCWSFTGHCAFFINEKCEDWKYGCINCKKDKTAYPSTVSINSNKNYELKKKLFGSVENMTVVTPCNWLTDLVKQSFMKDREVRTVYNGIDTEVFKPVTSDIKSSYVSHDKKIVLGVANIWEQRKGLDDMLKLSYLLGDDYRVVLIGLNKNQIAALPKNVIGFERTKNAQELAKWYTAADVFVNPTYEDNFPTVNIEAQACGTPVAVYDTGGCSEGIKSGLTGISVKTGDTSALANAVELLARTKSECTKACAENARLFCLNRMAENYKEIYRGL